MIYVNRSQVSRPPVFFSDRTRRSIERVEAFYNQPVSQRAQKRYNMPFDSEWRKEITLALGELFRGKCAYCESLIPLETSYAEFDHFRPKQGARGFDEAFAGDHYWWLAFEWENLYYSCSQCNRYKNTWFPVTGRYAPEKTPYLELDSWESPLLLDPCRDRPEDHLSFTEDGQATASTERGHATINILKLNRSELVASRRRSMEELNAAFIEFLVLLNEPGFNEIRVGKILESWKGIITGSSPKPYLALHRQLLEDWLNSYDLWDHLMINDFKISKEAELLKGAFGIEPMLRKKRVPQDNKDLTKEAKTDHVDAAAQSRGHAYVQRMELKNFKCFAELNLEFSEKETDSTDDRNSVREPWLIFLGENGVGKSSILKAFVLGLSGQRYIDKLGIIAEDILKNGTDSGYIKIYLVGEEKPIEVSFDVERISSSIDLPAANIVGYNAVRVEAVDGKLRPERSPVAGVKARSLFDFTYSLVNGQEWLAALAETEFNRVALTLKDLMSLGENDTIVLDDKGKALVSSRTETFKVSELSDGYKSVFYLAVDIMAAFERENITYDLAEGLILIDEIGTHLHPRWKMQVVERLRLAFPRLRFVVTTHEPLCLRGINDGETVVLMRDEDREVVALTELPNPAELRIDQILTSVFFGLSSTMDPQTEQIFTEYYSLLALQADSISGAQAERLQELQAIIPRIKHLGDTEREDIIYDVVDRLLARRGEKNRSKNTIDLKAEALEQVRILWDQLGQPK